MSNTEEKEDTLPVVIFVLGGPGAGKGTQCLKIAEKYGFNHLSAGDLLRAEKRKKDSKNGELIRKCIEEGKIVPGDVTVTLLSNAMTERKSSSKFFLVDGFPRNDGNLSGWKKIVGEKAKVASTLFFSCSYEILEKRLLQRGKTSGRSDDNLESIKKRFVNYEKETLPILDKLEKDGIKIEKIDSSVTKEKVFDALKSIIDKVIDENTGKASL
mmetsp:Transcript_21730/g.35017  ORF Transcript_21730/g.35017 Transcript_21730/m.35017 type:complete len:213 (+) Transcript_21730:56-694(+)